MSKPQLVVLGFLKKQPMYGYKIGQVVEELNLHVWGGIKLPSIYKALQQLEKSGHIRGEQVTEGNNPPRTVYHLEPSGDKLLRDLVRELLAREDFLPTDWWLIVSFSWKAISREELERSILRRLQKIESFETEKQKIRCSQMAATGEAPFIINHIVNLGIRHHAVELEAIKVLLEDIRSGKHDESFFYTGDEN